MNLSRVTLVVSLLLFNFAIGAEAFGQHSVLSKMEIEKRRRETKARIEKEKRLKASPAYQLRLANEKRKRDTQQRIKDLRRGQRTRAKTGSSGTRTINVRATTTAKPKFNAAQAGSPAVTLAKFLHTAKSARNIDQLLPYFTQERQASVASDKRKYFQQQDRTKAPPGASDVKFYGAIAKDVLSVQSEKVTGHTAKLSVVVRRDTEIDGQKYDRGVAIFTMRGEGNSWRLVGVSSGTQVFSSKGEML